MRSLVVALVLVAGRFASAEDAADCTSVRAGERVRVAARGLFAKPAVGRLLKSDAATLRVVTKQRSVSVPRASITHLERSTRRSLRRLGLKIGAGIGFAAGAALGVRSLRDSDDGSGYAMVIVPFAGLAGTIPGGLVGAAIAPGERWSREDPSKVCVQRTVGGYRGDPRVRVGVAPALIPGRGAGMRLTLAF